VDLTAALSEGFSATSSATLATETGLAAFLMSTSITLSPGRKRCVFQMKKSRFFSLRYKIK
jgi:hypothetical protein